MQWTEEQQKVISLRNRNILVSAAAGSGKTAVLVERIISMITDEENPIDIDRLLIVTFTNAAAAEMRERIGDAIERKLNEFPDSLHLQKQITLVHSAQITTIHSFCLNIIRNHFNSIQLDPSFRIADEAELTLIKSDVIADLMENCYEEGREEFLRFIECFSTGKSDEVIEGLILRLYEFSMSYPWSEEWLLEKKADFAITSLEEMKNSMWMRALLAYIHTISEDLLNRCLEAIAICEEADGPGNYLPALQCDKELLMQLLTLKDYEEYRNAFTGFSFARLSGKKEEGVSEEKKNEVKGIREEIKKAVGDVIKNYFYQPAEEMLADIMAMKGPMEELIRLTIEFLEAYRKKKAEKNIVDFSDLEHFALNILVHRADEKDMPTPAADELSEHFVEIMVDEYQDSNLVQETILNSVSGGRFGRPNLFMVGDVKQSIYKFRLARPELFMDKYDTYSLEDGSNQRIDLHKNFRSREVVLNGINYIFEQIMTKKLGNIVYDDKAALYPGADFGEEREGVAKDTELILVTVEPEEKEEESSGETIGKKEAEEENEYTGKEIEARAIAKRIYELTDEEKGLLIFDKKKNCCRRAVFGDIVILLRTMSDWSEVFADTLSAQGIPTHTETQSGYFSTLEIRTVLNLLRIIDNPRQDIPFAAILRSPIVGLSNNELAYIRIARKKMTMYEAVLVYVKEKDDERSVKLTGFLSKLEQYRGMVCHLPIHELIIKVLEDTGYYHFASAMPAGEKRKANIDMLIQRAISFESTSYSGLFHFVRYIEKLHKYNIDFGEAKIISENDNTVKIMSIHKSKGLEFPIVFAAGMGKNFNNQDSRSNLLIHPDFGLGPDYIDPELRMKAPTLIKKIIQKELVLENLGEELRVLYVALTRAKEKLIMTGSIKSLEKVLCKWANVTRHREKPLFYYQLSSAAAYLDWIIPAAIRYRGFEDLLAAFHIRQDGKNPLYDGNAEISIKHYSYDELAFDELTAQLEKEAEMADLFSWRDDTVYNEGIRQNIISYLEYQYPYRKETNIHTKLTVSELKRLGQMEAEELTSPLKALEKKEAGYPVPGFVGEGEIKKGADLGTLYHTVLEAMDFTRDYEKAEILSFLEGMYKEGRISDMDLMILDIDKIHHFLGSSIAERMRKAGSKEKLHRERQFIMGVKANEINSSLKSEELVLVQGVIDVYFEEEDKWILLDYKTDAVDKEEGEQVLARRYKVQLDYYQKALEQLTGKKVKERYLYSFYLNKEIRI